MATLEDRKLRSLDLVPLAHLTTPEVDETWRS